MTNDSKGNSLNQAVGNEKQNESETAMTERERLLKVFTDDSFRSSRPNRYYPGAGEYHPSKVIAGRA